MRSFRGFRQPAQVLSLGGVFGAFAGAVSVFSGFARTADARCGLTRLWRKRGFSSRDCGDLRKAHGLQGFIPIHVEQQVPAGIHPLHLARARAEEKETHLVDLLVPEALRRPRAENATSPEDQRQPRAGRQRFSCFGPASIRRKACSAASSRRTRSTENFTCKAGPGPSSLVGSSGSIGGISARLFEIAQALVERRGHAARPLRVPAAFDEQPHTPHSPARMRRTISARAGESFRVWSTAASSGPFQAEAVSGSGCGKSEMRQGASSFVGSGSGARFTGELSVKLRRKRATPGSFASAGEMLSSYGSGCQRSSA